MDKLKLANYFRRCLKGLPYHYVGLDSNRLTAIYFSVLGLDLIDELHTIDKQQIIEYIYSMQLTFTPTETAADLVGQSGFMGSSYLGQRYSRDGHRYQVSCTCEDSIFQYLQGHIAMTYSAISALKALGDDLQRVDKKAIIAGLKFLQEENGSFRCTMSPNECDTRFIYCACAVSSHLDDWSGVDCNQAVRYIKSCLTYEGGISLHPGGEAHGGSTFCALASLSIMGRLHPLSSSSSSSTSNDQNNEEERLTSEEFNRILNWCLKRQANLGYNGRCNKDCDSCYSFWIGGSIDLLSSFHLTDFITTRETIIQHYQNTITGGFSKLPDNPVDIIHSFYSTAYLSLASSEGTKSMNSAFCLRHERVNSDK